MNERMSFKAWLVQNNITQLEIARLLKISLTSVNSKINGRGDFTLRQIRTICQKYNISADIFL